VTRNSKGFTLIELLIVVGLIGVLGAIAAGTMFNARISGNEASAIGSLRAIVTAEIDYNALNRGFAVNLSELSALCPGMRAPFISADLDTNGVTKNGFTYNAAAGFGSAAGPNDCNGVVTQSAFYATAVPVTYGRTGNRGFAANQPGTIWQDTSGAAPVEPFAIAGTVSPIGR
jgi:type IV pilus assembly protein PilA